MPDIFESTSEDGYAYFFRLDRVEDREAGRVYIGVTRSGGRTKGTDSPAEINEEHWRRDGWRRTIKAVPGWTEATATGRTANQVIEDTELAAVNAARTLEAISELLYNLQSTGQLANGDSGSWALDSQVISARGALRRAEKHATELVTALRDARVATSNLTTTDGGQLTL